MEINNNLSSHQFDLEPRTLEFAKRVIDLIRVLPKNSANFIFVDQLIRSATSVRANYREANDSLGKNDFRMRIRICRKEAKETKYWLELILYNNPDLASLVQPLLREVIELIKIFSSIVAKTI